jgi:hypothetical protein
MLDTYNDNNFNSNNPDNFPESEEIDLDYLNSLESKISIVKLSKTRVYNSLSLLILRLL